MELPSLIITGVRNKLFAYEKSPAVFNLTMYPVAVIGGPQESHVLHLLIELPLEALSMYALCPPQHPHHHHLAKLFSPCV